MNECKFEAGSALCASSPLWWNYMSAVSVMSYVMDSAYFTRLRKEMPELLPLAAAHGWLLCIPVDTSSSLVCVRALRAPFVRALCRHDTACERACIDCVLLWTSTFRF